MNNKPVMHELNNSADAILAKNQLVRGIGLARLISSHAEAALSGNARAQPPQPRAHDSECAEHAEKIGPHCGSAPEFVPDHDAEKDVEHQRNQHGRNCVSRHSGERKELAL